MGHDENRETEVGTILKAIRHSGARLYKSLPPIRVIEEIEHLRDLCTEFLAKLAK